MEIGVWCSFVRGTLTHGEEGLIIIGQKNNEIMTILLLTFIWLFVINTSVAIHFYYIERRRRKRSPSHIISFVVVFLLALGLSCHFYDTVTMRVVSVIYLGLLYWMVFNLGLNFFRKKPPLYLGEDGDPDEDSVLDTLERSFKSPGGTLGLKFVLWVMSLFALIQF